MSNAGLDRFLKTLDLKLARSAVGDRYVLEEMAKGGFNVGGEQSGHIILSDFSTTGDGLVAALQVLAVLAQDGKPASEAAHLYEPLPQVLEKTVYVGLSAGSMIMTRYGTTYGHHTLPADTPKCLGWLDFALHPHLDCPGMADNALACIEALASELPMVSYALDDDSAIQVVDGEVSVISEGTWRRFVPGGER